MKTLDLEAVQAFTLVADLRSFTRAAEVLETTQSAISLKLKRLEDGMGRRLFDRTPRHVRLTAEGEAFLEPARNLMNAHNLAIGSFAVQPQRLAIGISHHILGAELPLILERMNRRDPALVIEMHIASSRDILQAFDTGILDAALVLRTDHRRDGETMFREKLAWIAAPNYQRHQGEPLRLATQAEPCSVRALAVRALDLAGISWTEVFIGGGVGAVGAAAAAGFAVAALALRVAPLGTQDCGQRLGLPPLPMSEIRLHAHVSDERSRGALRTLTASFCPVPVS
jgi:DNA-binding transcriptional LysR family regulator